MKTFIKILIGFGIYLIFRLISDDFVTGWLAGIVSTVLMILIDYAWEDNEDV